QNITLGPKPPLITRDSFTPHDQSILITATTLTVLINIIKFFSNQEIKHRNTYGRWPWN
ncbi:hypothetical protein P879_11104, partial [Paragonimus westermani]